MMRQSAFSKEHGMLKGGLHFHTNRSDGGYPPEALIRYCHDRGYDFLSLTDHEIYNYENFAPEIPMTIIPGVEHADTFCREKGFRTFHEVYIGPSKEDGNGYDQDERLEASCAPAEEFQSQLDDAHARNNLTILCHPEWSQTPARYFDRLRGNFAMEIWNSTSAILYDVDTNAAYWDELLGQGQRIYGVAVDDAHSFDLCCHGWVMVNAENSVAGILRSLESGAFYASCGPEIYDFYVDGGKAVVCCSPASRVRFLCDRHTPVKKVAKGDPFTRCEIDFDPRTAGYLYLRAEVTDAAGNRAWTNPIFFE